MIGTCLLVQFPVRGRYGGGGVGTGTCVGSGTSGFVRRGEGGGGELRNSFRPRPTLSQRSNAYVYFSTRHSHTALCRTPATKVASKVEGTRQCETSSHSRGRAMDVRKAVVSHSPATSIPPRQISAKAHQPGMNYGLTDSDLTETGSGVGVPACDLFCSDERRAAIW